MPAFKTRMVFGPRGAPDVEQPLPMQIDSCKMSFYCSYINLRTNRYVADEKCLLQIFTTGKNDVSLWYRMWEAVTAVYSICVRAGFGGSFTGLGECP